MKQFSDICIIVFIALCSIYILGSIEILPISKNLNKNIWYISLMFNLIGNCLRLYCWKNHHDKK